MPSRVKTIEDCAFGGCSSLTSIIIPATVTSIGHSAFYGCKNLTSAIFESTEGWTYTFSDPNATGTKISAEDLADTSKAAQYLNSTLCSRYWKHSDN